MATQYGEEKVITKFYPEWHTMNGIFIDVGAADGIENSNTYFLYTVGWGGVYIEPDPNQFAMLSSNIQSGTNIALINKAVSTIEGLQSFYSEHGQASTLSKEFMQRVILKYGTQYAETKVECRTLTHILKDTEINHIDFMSVDAEGNDIDAINSLDWGIYRPKLVCIEHSMPKKDLIALMTEKKYDRYEETLGNTFFRDIL